MTKHKSKRSYGPYSKPPEALISFGDRVREVRVGWEWTQQRLAEAIGVSQKTISHWERDDLKGRLPSAAALNGLVRITNISAEVWRTGKDFSFPDPPFDIGGLLIPAALNTRVTPLPNVHTGICLIDPDCEWSVKVIHLPEAKDIISAAIKAGQPIWLVVPSVLPG